jgi:N-glycosylase/DNA lyase
MHKEYSKRKKEIKQRLADFSKVKGDDIFYELCFCILTPQSNAKKCHEAVCLLKEKDFKNKKFDPVKYLKGKTRFHNNKARYLVEMKKRYNELKHERDYIVKNVKGIGLKEASHFLRNIGHRDNAILDRHILKNLVKFEAIKEIPKTLTPKKYFEIEEKFKKFSKKVRIPMDELDLLFWSMQTGEVFK